jgi:dual 3',5'-cyclic-AMP and -GMP phosphodiesterase 11
VVISFVFGIAQNVSILTNADRCSLFLVQGERGSESRCLVSKLFDVCSQSTLEEMEKKEEIRIPWGSGIVGYVAHSGEPLNIPDAYKVWTILFGL